jgi:putative PIN family toxin of toxin-antitoxin system
MIRVVVDTNVLVSALIKAHGAEAFVLSLVAEKTLSWCASPSILAEYGAVLGRRKFVHLSETYVTALLKLAGEAELVTPSFVLKESPHEPDNRFLECAEAATADYLVTGNLRHFPTQWKKTRIVNARQLLQAVNK